MEKDRHEREKSLMNKKRRKHHAHRPPRHKVHTNKHTPFAPQNLRLRHAAHQSGTRFHRHTETAQNLIVRGKMKNLSVSRSSGGDGRYIRAVLTRRTSGTGDDLLLKGGRRKHGTQRRLDAAVLRTIDKLGSTSVITRNEARPGRIVIVVGRAPAVAGRGESTHKRKEEEISRKKFFP